MAASSVNGATGREDCRQRSARESKPVHRFVKDAQSAADAVEDAPHDGGGSSAGGLRPDPD